MHYVGIRHRLVLLRQLLELLLFSDVKGTLKRPDWRLNLCFRISVLWYFCCTNALLEQRGMLVMIC